jgi:hypothetical protein
LSGVVETGTQLRGSRAHDAPRPAEIRGTWFWGGSALLFAASTAITIVWCASMSAMGARCGATPAAQPWANGRVGLNGVSYQAISQWRVAALRPKSLVAICPWEGWSDIYHDVARPGGGREDGFIDFWATMTERDGRVSESLRPSPAKADTPVGPRNVRCIAAPPLAKMAREGREDNHEHHES